MARIDRDRSASGPLIQAFSGNGFRIDQIVYEGGVKLTAEAVWPWTSPSLEALAEGDLLDLIDTDRVPEFILLGTGATLRRPAGTLTAALQSRGVGLEVMDSRAAARTWGVLRGEGRWIAAALMPLD